MKIHKLTLQNFKAFKEPETFPFESKHILAYGANGSGKSSLFKAIRYLFKSSIQNEEDVSNYFDRVHPETVKNIFAEGDVESYVSIETKATIGAGNTTSNEYKFSAQHRPNVREIQDGLFLSDFINYRLLFHFSQFGDYEDANIYEAIKREFFPIWYDTNGNGPIDSLLDSTEVRYLPLPPNRVFNLLGWHNHLADELARMKGKQFAAQSSGTLRPVHPNARPYKNLVDKINQFNIALESLLNDITRAANTHLRSFLRIPDLELRFEYSTKLAPDSANSRHWEFNSPVIRLVLELQGEIIQRPHTFLNEARLTALAFAIRLAAFEQSQLNRPQESGLRVFVLDDILMSMDMSNRFQFFQFILTSDLLKNHQKIILTHERDLFDQIWAMIESYSKIDTKDWKRFELYESTFTPQGQYQNPTLIIDSLNDRDKALAYFHQKDYPTSSIYYRKAIEGRLKAILQDTIFGLQEKNGKYTPILTLEKLRKAAIDYCKYQSFDPTPLEHIGVLRLALNQSAHDNIRSSLFRNELLTMQHVLEELYNIKGGRAIRKGKEISLVYLDQASQAIGATITIELQDDLRFYAQGTPKHHYLRAEHNSKVTFASAQGKVKNVKIDHPLLEPILRNQYEDGQEIDVMAFKTQPRQDIYDLGYIMQVHNARGQSVIDNIKRRLTQNM